MLYTLVVTAALTVFATTYIVPLLVNYQKARQSGFPILVSPVDPHNPIWMVVGGVLIVPLSRILPMQIWTRLRYATHGWAFLDQDRGIYAPSPAFMFVSSGKNQLWIEDPEITLQIIARRQDFLQANMSRTLIGIMGPNVLTTDGHDWQRHRRIVTAALGERIQKIVWNESVDQAETILEEYPKCSGGVTDDTIDGLRRLAVNVLSLSGYNVQGISKSRDDATRTGHRLSYTEVLDALASGFILIAMLGGDFLSSKLMPEALRTFGTAAKEFPVYTKELLAEERAAQASSTEHKRSFIASLVALSAEAQDDAKLRLSEDEIQGNLFQFTLAGFDTTANTLAYAVVLLAVHEEWQDWVFEEVTKVAAEHGDAAYETLFPHLKRCLALMYETLRLYTPVANISRSTTTAQTITTATTTYTVPAKTDVFVSLASMHTKPSLWGPDATTFRPTRWLSSPQDPTTGTEAEAETFINVPAGTFLPWSGGPRICPGMKMAQVEFVATIYTLLRGFRVRPALLAGESAVEARARTLGVVRDSLPRLTLQMNRPRDVKLAWERRSVVQS